MKKRKHKNQLILWIALVAIALAAALWVGVQLGQRGTPASPADSAPSAAPSATATAALSLDPNLGPTPTPAPTEPGVAIPGWAEIRLPAGSTEASVSLTNPDTNAGWYYLTFELRLIDSGEVIFTTGLIPPGETCTAVSLTRALEAGEYAAVMHVQPYRISDQSPTNNADMETTLIVE